MKRLLSAAVGVTVLWPLSGRSEVDVEGFEKVVQPFLGQYCTTCHGAEKQEAKLALHNLEADFDTAGGRATWEDILDMLSLGEMPPEDEKQPDVRMATRVADWVRAELEKSGQILQDKRVHPGFGNYVDHDVLFKRVSARGSATACAALAGSPGELRCGPAGHREGNLHDPVLTQHEQRRVSGLCPSLQAGRRGPWVSFLGMPGRWPNG